MLYCSAETMGRMNFDRVERKGKRVGGGAGGVGEGGEGFGCQLPNAQCPTMSEQPIPVAKR